MLLKCPDLLSMWKTWLLRNEGRLLPGPFSHLLHCLSLIGWAIEIPPFFFWTMKATSGIWLVWIARHLPHFWRMLGFSMLQPKPSTKPWRDLLAWTTFWHAWTATLCQHWTEHGSQHFILALSWRRMNTPNMMLRNHQCATFVNAKMIGSIGFAVHAFNIFAITFLIGAPTTWSFHLVFWTICWCRDSSA